MLVSSECAGGDAGGVSETQNVSGPSMVRMRWLTWIIIGDGGGSFLMIRGTIGRLGGINIG